MHTARRLQSDHATYRLSFLFPVRKKNPLERPSDSVLTTVKHVPKAAGDEVLEGVVRNGDVFVAARLEFTPGADASVTMLVGVCTPGIFEYSPTKRICIGLTARATPSATVPTSQCAPSFAKIVSIEKADLSASYISRWTRRKAWASLLSQLSPITRVPLLENRSEIKAATRASALRRNASCVERNSLDTPVGYCAFQVEN